MKSDPHILDLLPEFLKGAISDAQRATIQAHIRDCAECRQEYESLSMLWSSLGTIADPVPGPSMRMNFEAMLTAYEHGAKQGWPRSSAFELVDELVSRLWPRRPAIQFAVAAVLFLIGGFLGSQIDRRIEKQANGGSSSEIAQLRGEVEAMSRMLAVSLMQQPSASERIRGASMSADLDSPDKQIINTLLTALNEDPNINVRLAAADALTRYGLDPLVRKGVIESLSRQKSPLVQVALVDALVQMQDTQSKPVIAQMLKEPKLNAAVKKKMEEALKQLL